MTRKVESIDDVRELVMHYKNTRSWFDGFVMLLYAGDILLIDNSYDYPVYYRTCGEFYGEKEFIQGDVGEIFIANVTYDYEVEYPVSEKISTVIEGESVNVENGVYDYIKRFPVAGEMETLYKQVNVQQAELSIVPRDYDYQIEYKAPEKKSATITGESTSFVNDTYNYAKQFQLAGEMTTLEKQTSVQKSKFTSDSEGYCFSNEYLVCGEFYAEGE